MRSGRASCGRRLDGMAQPGRLKIGIISAGKVGTALGGALRNAGHTIIGAYAASEDSRDRLDAMLPGVPAREPAQIVDAADAVILAVPDSELAGLVGGLAKLGAWRQGQVVVHTAARFGTGVLDPAARAGAIPLALHPAMTFTGTSLDIARLQGCPMAVTGAPLYLPIAQAMAAEMGGEPAVIEEEDRPLYHAALTHASSHLATVLTQAQRMLAAAGVTDAAGLLATLVDSAVEGVRRGGEARLTGPAAIGDAEAVRDDLLSLRGLAATGDDGDILDSYRALSRATAERANRRRLLGDRAAEAVRQALDGK